MQERDKYGDGISIYLLFTYVIMPEAMTLIAGQKSSLIMFWQKIHISWKKKFAVKLIVV